MNFLVILLGLVILSLIIYAVSTMEGLWIPILILAIYGIIVEVLAET